MEQVLVVERKALETRLGGQVLLRGNIAPVVDFILHNHSFAPRAAAEYDNSLKQIIPYVVIRQEGRYFVTKRLKKQTEARLHDKLSLGIGGHINPGEQLSPGQTVLEAGLYRELFEEVYVERIRSLDWVAVLNENGGVGEYHTGLVCLLEAEGEVYVRETEKLEGQWLPFSALEDLAGRFESWSLVVLEELLSLMESRGKD